MSEHITFCRICEPCCGLIATVIDDRLVDVRADKENPFSEGFMCTKAKAMVEIVEDPDRVLRPLRRTASGDFVQVSWDEALNDIADRMGEVIRRHGAHTVAMFLGNPVSFNVSAVSSAEGFRKAIGARWKYGVGAEDSASMLISNALVFGSAGLMPRPDVWHTDFLLVLGANPWVSKGSAISEPKIRQAMQEIVDRGGRVVVLDPRRTETAKHFEHIAIRPGTDPWFLLGLLRVIIDEDLVDRAFVREHTRGFEKLAELVMDLTVDECSERCRVPAESIVELARSFAGAGRAVAYGRTGTCTQQFGTLANLLINMLNVVTGNLNRRGGSLFGWAAIDIAKMAKQSGYDSYGQERSRTTGLPDVWGLLPSQCLRTDILEPGADKLRVLITCGGNPVNSSGGGGTPLADALDTLDLHVSMDIYVNETNKHADYILPTTTFYERADLPFLAMGMMVRPALYTTGAVISPRGEAREEWRIFNDLARRLGRGGAYPVAFLRWLSKIGMEIDPLRLMDLMIRLGPAGDRFGLRRRGWSLGKLRKHRPHGVILRDDLPIPPLESVVEFPDHRVNCAPPELFSEAHRLREHPEDPNYPLRSIGMREVRSHNTWMHNSERLVPDGRHPIVLVHPDDAADAGLVTEGLLRITSAHGEIVMAARATSDVSRGTVVIPHGWGHDGGWTRANAAGGANSNALTPTAVPDLEAVAGMSVLNGIPVRISAIAHAGGTRTSAQ